jgi:hypothetical protein
MGLGQCGGRFYIGFHIVWFETSMVLANAVAVSISDSISYGLRPPTFSPFQALSRQWELVQDQSCPITEPPHNI